MRKIFCVVCGIITTAIGKFLYFNKPLTSDVYVAMPLVFASLYLYNASAKKRAGGGTRKAIRARRRRTNRTRHNMACVSPSDDGVLIQCNPTYVRVNILTHAYIHLSTCLMDRIYQVPPISLSLPGPVLQFKRAPSNLNYIFTIILLFITHPPHHNLNHIIFLKLKQ